jgi:hypothetical protein
MTNKFITGKCFVCEWYSGMKIYVKAKIKICPADVTAYVSFYDRQDEIKGCKVFLRTGTFFILDMSYEEFDKLVSEYQEDN